jgi:hypothetical protein
VLWNGSDTRTSPIDRWIWSIGWVRTWAAPALYLDSVGRILATVSSPMADTEYRYGFKGQIHGLNPEVIIASTVLTIRACSRK